MKIAIATGIYPPEIGGPAEYARQLYETFLILEEKAVVVTYADLKRFPSGIRHFFYFFKLVFGAFSADYVIALDTWSAAIPAVFFALFFRKKIVVRVGGDFLWESYVERTKEKILLSEFYKKSRKFSLKEKIIFFMTKRLLWFCDRVVFSTDWQRLIWQEPYNLYSEKAVVIENFFPKVFSKDSDLDAFQYNDADKKKIFLSPARPKVIKNIETVQKVFEDLNVKYPEVEFDTTVVSRDVLLEKIQKSYAVVVASFSEVSPNLVCDALQYGVPVILTYDNGMKNRFENKVVLVDPLSSEDIKRGVETLLDKTMYEAYRQAILANDYSHSWNEIAQEFLDLFIEL